jgi:4-hydroxy-3-polyprenylbenzoate decarboxylase
MPFTGLSDFITALEKQNNLLRIRYFVDPVLEISEVTDRISKSGGKAILFENTGTSFPVLINAFGSEKRMAAALGRKNLDDAAREIAETFSLISGPVKGFREKLSSIPSLLRIRNLLPSRKRGRGWCQQLIHNNPDLSFLPVLKCWPFDGGRFITLPMVHTVHPVTGKTNVGMYRMQVLDNRTTAMHWQRHKTGAAHFEEWRKTGMKMPVTVTLGGDPVYTYAATAPLPENIDEYILAGFLRKRKVKLVKCITNDLYVPADADIVIEGYVDPAEDMVQEGPFGDHTGYYSLQDLYPKFHVTCITHSREAVYPATIVGIPPMEDKWLALATEKMFISPLKMVIVPELLDFHMPAAGVAHNLVIVKIRKSWPGQGKKVISSLFGAGQMMFTKYLVVVSGDVDIRNYSRVLDHILENTLFTKDLISISGPLDDLDHAAAIPALGGKLGIDATEKIAGEILPGKKDFSGSGSGIEIITANLAEGPEAAEKAIKEAEAHSGGKGRKIIVIVGNAVDTGNMDQVAWQVLGNSDPLRDASVLSDDLLIIDGTPKVFHKPGYPRRWPNVVVSSPETITTVDTMWEALGAGPFIKSPSVSNSALLLPGDAEVNMTFRSSF